MIITHPNYLDQTQCIGLEGIIDHHGLVHVSIAGVYGISYDKPDTHSKTFDKPSTNSKTYDKPTTHPRTYDN